MRSSGDNSWCSDGVATDDRDKLVALMLSIYQGIWVGVRGSVLITFFLV